MADRRAPGRIRPVQERMLARYVSGHIYPYSAFYRARFVNGSASVSTGS